MHAFASFLDLILVGGGAQDGLALLGTAASTRLPRGACGEGGVMGAALVHRAVCLAHGDVPREEGYGLLHVLGARARLRGPC
jgi:hypothetical protein